MSKLNRPKKEKDKKKEHKVDNSSKGISNKNKMSDKVASNIDQQITKKKKRRYRGKKPTANTVISVAPPKLKNLQKENISSNWKSLMQNMSESKRPKSSPATDISPFKRLKLSDSKTKKVEESESKPAQSEEIWFDDVDESLLEITSKETSKLDPEKLLVKEKSFKGVTKIIGIDCEMVGVGQGGTESIVGRVSLVNHYGHLIYDTYVAPTEDITDYRTSVSGIRPKDLSGAPNFKEVQNKVAETIKGKILVGHALHNDLKVLFLSHPRKLIRDTSTYKPFRTQFGGKTPGLKKLIEHYIGVSVQTGEHSSVQDAQAAVRLYTLVRKEWENTLMEKRKKRFAFTRPDGEERTKEEA